MWVELGSTESKQFQQRDTIAHLTAICNAGRERSSGDGGERSTLKLNQILIKTMRGRYGTRQYDKSIHLLGLQEGTLITEMLEHFKQ